VRSCAESGAFSDRDREEETRMRAEAPSRRSRIIEDVASMKATTSRRTPESGMATDPETSVAVRPERVEMRAERARRRAETEMEKARMRSRER
jgi:hypothetical protein